MAARFIAELKPAVLAMCGVCAGRPGWTNLGDVVIADMIYKYDAGEHIRTTVAGPALFKADQVHYDEASEAAAIAQRLVTSLLEETAP